MISSKDDQDRSGNPIPLQLQADSLTRLAAKAWLPVVPDAAKVAVVINPGAGIRASFYERYARFLAGAGLVVLTYDYRGIGDSRPPTLRGYTASVEDWGSKDCARALQWVKEQFPGLNVAVIGHSVGAFLTGFVPNGSLIDRFLTISGHTAYWRDYAPMHRLSMYLLWHVFMPAITSLVGYFPGRALHLLEDLPAGIAHEWARRIHPEFYWDVRDPGGDLDHKRVDELLQRFASIRAPMLAYSFSDDPFATEAATRRLLSTFPGCAAISIRYSPADLGVQAIGHFGFFHERFRATLWHASVKWLLSEITEPQCV